MESILSAIANNLVCPPLEATGVGDLAAGQPSDALAVPVIGITVRALCGPGGRRQGPGLTSRWDGITAPLSLIGNKNLIPSRETLSGNPHSLPKVERESVVSLAQSSQTARRAASRRGAMNEVFRMEKEEAETNEQTKRPVARGGFRQTGPLAREEGGATTSVGDRGARLIQVLYKLIPTPLPKNLAGNWASANRVILSIRPPRGVESEVHLSKEAI